MAKQKDTYYKDIHVMHIGWIPDPRQPNLQSFCGGHLGIYHYKFAFSRMFDSDVYPKLCKKCIKSGRRFQW